MHPKVTVLFTFSSNETRMSFDKIHEHPNWTYVKESILDLSIESLF